MTKEHAPRLGIIFLTCGALGAAMLFGHLDGVQKAHLEGALAVLFPALLDSLRVGQNQRIEKAVRESLRPGAR